MALWPLPNRMVFNDTEERTVIGFDRHEVYAKQQKPSIFSITSISKNRRSVEMPETTEC